MRKDTLKPTLYSEMGPYALMNNSKEMCISALYVSYCENIKKNNSLLYKNSLSSLSKDDVSRALLTLTKKLTKTYTTQQYKINALDLAIRNFLDYRFSNSNIYLSELVTDLLDVQKSDVVFDFGSGTGAFLAYIACQLDDSFIRHELRGVEISGEDVDLSKMVLEMCDAKYSIRNLDLLRTEIDSKFAAYDKGYIFPPIGLKTENSDITLNIKYKDLLNSRSSTEWSFVLKALEGLKDNGRLVALLPDSALFKASDADVRKFLLEEKMIEGIISLSSNAFAENNTKMSIVVFSKNNESFKYVDGEEILKDLPVKGLNSDEAANDLLIAYNLQNVRRCTMKNVETIHYNLSLNSILVDYIDDKLPELQSVADIFRGCNMTRANFEDEIYEGESGYQILTSSDIQENGSIDYEKLTYIGGDKKYDKFTIQKDDVVMTSKSTRVKVAVVDKEPTKKIVVTGGMIIIRPHKDELNGTYLKIYFSSEKGRKTLSYIQKGSTIVTISFENLLKIRVDLPPKEEQDKIASEYQVLNLKYEKAKQELSKVEKSIDGFINKNVK